MYVTLVYVKVKFCPSCHQKRVVEFGEWLCMDVLKKVPHRHFVARALVGYQHPEDPPPLLPLRPEAFCRLKPLCLGIPEGLSLP